MADVDKLVDDLSGMTVLEVADLVKALEEKWGVSAAAPVARELIKTYLRKSLTPDQVAQDGAAQDNSG